MSRGEYSAVIPSSDGNESSLHLAVPRSPASPPTSPRQRQRRTSHPSSNDGDEDEHTSLRAGEGDDLVVYEQDIDDKEVGHAYVDPTAAQVSPTLDRSWLAAVSWPVSLRTVLLSILSIVVLLLMILLFHPASPYAYHFNYPSSDYYKGHPELKPGTFSSNPALAKNPLPEDAHFNDVPFAQVGDNRLAHDKQTPHWAGGDGGAAKEEKEKTSGWRSNGTHWFDRTVILVSLDGVRSDYLTRNLTPHLLSVSKKGLRAESLQPSFPTLTFPNHYSLITGLYPSSHGIIANDFWDPNLGKEFVYTKPEQSWGPEWWGGEPIWSTAVKNGLKANVLMWPSPPMMADGTKPTRWYAFHDHYHYSRKLLQIASWLDLPHTSRPNLILAYAPEVDQEGHRTGPDSKALEDELLEMDDFAKGLTGLLEERNLTEVVDVVFVSDHGMTGTHNERLVFLDDILGKEGFEGILTAEGWPSVGLRFKPDIDADLMLSKLRQAATESKGGFNVYTQEDMPERWHFTGNERIAPIYVVPHPGWAITNHHEFEVEMKGQFTPAGNHGYDNADPDMQAIFIAHGPFASRLKSQTLEQNPNLIKRTVLSERAEGVLEKEEMTLIPAFENVEVYDLLCELLDIKEDNRARTNGSTGFWKKYLE
ncbi:BZ3500_MvSof-1268-A1-R1_Chr1-1g01253 [Microbotryum saponariae]|uniref:BZ3500_MvSof-1268-A1-R1_Chr1-1g01253 protein n=1 Tax=Microbotryum saponariae TaxID=289078 RepID=A0A2X0K8W7_9BASI|nr:BZ3500_MvSof-1268-A1-R1_Chr1-1g01253 [Microbotryum saponariae]SCZ93793.1 BZ3501_MvSof-1269-A2-R1_Chr1-1g00849 [Microbotryum saponariae]